jgi:hypothetical protein
MIDPGHGETCQVWQIVSPAKTSGHFPKNITIFFQNIVMFLEIPLDKPAAASKKSPQKGDGYSPK